MLFSPKIPMRPSQLKLAALLAISVALGLPHQLASAGVKADGENFRGQLEQKSAPWVNLTSEKVTNSQFVASDLLDRAFKTSEKLEGDRGQSEALEIMAINYAKIGQIDKAIEIAQNINDSYSKANSLSEISQAAAKAGQSDRALKLADKIADKEQQIIALSQIARFQQQAGKTDKAAEIFNRAVELAKKSESSSGLAEIAKAYSQAGDYDTALSIAQSIEYKGTKVNALVAIAAELFKTNQLERSNEILSQALAISPEINYKLDRSKALVEIANQYRESGQSDRAAEVLGQAVKIAQQVDESYLEDAKAESLTEIATSYAKLGQTDRAVSLLETAAQAIQGEEVLLVQAFKSGKIASKYAAIGQFDRALALAKTINKLELAGKQSASIAETAPQYAAAGDFDRAVKLADSIQDSWRKTSALIEIAGYYIAAGKTEPGLQLVQKAKSRYKKSLLINLIDEYIESDPNSAIAPVLLPATLQEAETEKDYFNRNYSIAQIALRYANIGQKDRALAVLAKSLKVDETKNPEMNAEILSLTAEVYAAIKDYDRALEVANKLSEAGYKGYTLGAIAGEAAKAGDYDRALSLSETIQGEEKITALTYIVQQYIKTGQKEKANQLIEQSLTAVQSISNTVPKERSLLRLIPLVAASGQYDRALELAKSITISAWQPDAIAEVSVELAKAKQYDRALAATKTIDTDSRYPIWGQIAAQAAKAQDLPTALQIADSIKDRASKSRALAAIAKELIKSGQKNQGLELLAQAEQLNQSVPNRYYFTNRALAEIAIESAKSGSIERAVKLADSMEDSWQKAQALAAIAGYAGDR